MKALYFVSHCHIKNILLGIDHADLLLQGFGQHRPDDLVLVEESS
jgi:hypothetical protein